MKKISCMGNNNQPLVSIITVCYNVVNSIENTIKSVINNKNATSEYIVIDGGSSDGTIDVIKKYEDYISVWISEQDTGIYNAMNKGLKYATGKYVIFINNGDYLLNIPINILSEEFYKSTVAICGSIISEDNEIQNPRYNWLMRLQNQLPHQGLFYKRERMRLYNEKFKIVGDYDLNLEMYLQKKEIRIIDKIIAFHSKLGISNSTKSGKESRLVIKSQCGIIYSYISWVYRKYKAIYHLFKKINIQIIYKHHDTNITQIKKN